MNKYTGDIGTNKLYEYQLVLNPHEDLRKKISRLKNDFADKYNHTSFTYARQQIVLVRFKQYDLAEERFVNRFNTIAMGHHPIKITLKDFGSYPTHSIYINVQAKVAIQELIRTIRSESQRLMKLNEDNKPHFIMEPHITIAGKLAPDKYEAAWKEYSHKSFTASFIADAMLLLKREERSRSFEIIRRFEFQNLLIGTSQSSLF